MCVIYHPSRTYMVEYHKVTKPVVLPTDNIAAHSGKLGHIPVTGIDPVWKHGGPTPKTVCTIPAEHFPTWRAKLAYAIRPPGCSCVRRRWANQLNGLQHRKRGKVLTNGTDYLRFPRA